MDFPTATTNRKKTKVISLSRSLQRRQSLGRHALLTRRGKSGLRDEPYERLCWRLSFASSYWLNSNSLLLDLGLNYKSARTIHLQPGAHDGLLLQLIMSPGWASALDVGEIILTKRTVDLDLIRPPRYAHLFHTRYYFSRILNLT